MAVSNNVDRQRAAHRFMWVAVLFLWLIFPASIHSQTNAHAPSAPRTIVSVAAASDLKFAFDAVIAGFQKTNPAIEVRTSFGSSGSFYAQLAQRAPFDLFLSADVMYPDRLIKEGLASADTKFIYAVGRIVVWSPANATSDPAKGGAKSLLDPSIRRIAIANPEHAPYGRAAVAALRSLGLYETVKPRLVFGENIAQTAQFIESGAADLGIISLSLTLAPPLKGKGSYWEVPTEMYPKMEQAGVILSYAKNASAARELRAYLLSPSGQAILRGHGFTMPSH